MESSDFCISNTSKLTLLKLLMILICMLPIKETFAYRVLNYHLLGFTAGYEMPNGFMCWQADYTQFGSSCSSRAWYYSCGAFMKCNADYRAYGINAEFEPLQLFHHNRISPVEPLILGFEPSLVVANADHNYQWMMTPYIGFKWFRTSLFTSQEADYFSPLSLRIEIMYGYGIPLAKAHSEQAGHMVTLKVGLGFNLHKQQTHVV